MNQPNDEVNIQGYDQRETGNHLLSLRSSVVVKRRKGESMPGRGMRIDLHSPSYDRGRDAGE
jgi:hypothetical protein